MPLQFVAGDLFANRYGVQAFAHGCNCQGSMGAGIAKTFRARYKAMYATYRERCRAQPRHFNLGDAWLWREEGQPWVFNLGTQEHYWRGRASYEAIATALAAMRAQADEAGITTIAMPKIGAGYGGLSWRKTALNNRSYGYMPDASSWTAVGGQRLMVRCAPPASPTRTMASAKSTRAKALGRRSWRSYAANRLP